MKYLQIEDYEADLFNFGAENRQYLFNHINHNWNWIEEQVKSWNTDTKEHFKYFIEKRVKLLKLAVEYGGTLLPDRDFGIEIDYWNPQYEYSLSSRILELVNI